MTIISVHGQYTQPEKPERAQARATVSVEGPDREAVLAAAVAAHRALVDGASELRAAGAISWWGSEQVIVQTRSRWNGDRQEHEKYESALADVTLRFTDFDALARWVTEAGSIEFVNIGPIRWDLTVATRDIAEREARVAAVAAAQKRAEDYAQALGGERAVRCVAIWEPGLRPATGSTGTSEYGARGAAVGAAAPAAAVELRPSDILVSAAVNADFEIRVP